jgi:phosphate transport system substrate-binding protein
MKKLIASVLTIVSFSVSAQISGAGSSFAAPLYSKWAEAYHKETKTQLNYQAVGSGAGINQIKAKTIDFGATDDPLSQDDLRQLGLYQFPTGIGGVVPVINIKGIESGKLVLDGKTLADIYMSKITKWNDPAITKLNPSLNLPDQNITIVVRSDSSGTTAVFTDYLSQVSTEFKGAVGASKQVQWKSNNITAGKGNAGVAAFTNQISGSIGYVEYAYVKQSKMTYVAMRNKVNKVVHPDDLTFAEAANKANWNVPGWAVNLNNQEGWPITSATFVLVYKGSERSLPVVKFFDWAFTQDKVAIDLDYVPVPQKVKDGVRAEWQKLALK